MFQINNQNFLDYETIQKDSVLYPSNQSLGHTNCSQLAKKLISTLNNFSLPVVSGNLKKQEPLSLAVSRNDLDDFFEETEETPSKPTLGLYRRKSCECLWCGGPSSLEKAIQNHPEIPNTIIQRNVSQKLPLEEENVTPKPYPLKKRSSFINSLPGRNSTFMKRNSIQGSLTPLKSGGLPSEGLTGLQGFTGLLSFGHERRRSSSKTPVQEQHKRAGEAGLTQSHFKFEKRGSHTPGTGRLDDIGEVLIIEKKQENPKKVTPFIDIKKKFQLSAKKTFKSTKYLKSSNKEAEEIKKQVKSASTSWYGGSIVEAKSYDTLPRLNTNEKVEARMETVPDQIYSPKGLKDIRMTQKKDIQSLFEGKTHKVKKIYGLLASPKEKQIQIKHWSSNSMSNKSPMPAISKLGEKSSHGHKFSLDVGESKTSSFSNIKGEAVTKRRSNVARTTVIETLDKVSSPEIVSPKTSQFWLASHRSEKVKALESPKVKRDMKCEWLKKVYQRTVE